MTHPNTLREVAEAAMSRWRAQGRPVRGAFIQGSAARYGTVTAGSDLDLCILVPREPDPAWAEEYVIGDVAVEVFPLDMALLADPESILASPALPFNLCEGVVVDDSDGLLHALRARLIPHLCAPRYCWLRAGTCYKQACAAYDKARCALKDGDLGQARYELTIGLWHMLGLDSAIVCRCPTNRRGFVYLWRDAAQWRHPELIALARQALGCSSLTEQTVRPLADMAGLIKERYRQGIVTMADHGEIEPAAWPLLCAALWRSTGDAPNADAQERILTALEYNSLTSVQQHLASARRLATSLWRIAQEQAG